jgi:hypothetical protein
MRAMKPAKAARDARRTHREAKARRRRDGQTTVQVMGGLMDPVMYARVVEALVRLDTAAPWDDIAPMVLPVLRRVRHPYPPEAAPIHLHVPPGIWTGFGIDIGPAFSHISAAMLEGWGVDRATLLGTALENLRRKVVEEPPQVQRFVFDGVELTGIQGQGWGSSLLLIPDVLGSILGVAPQMLIAPVRNTLIALPDDVEPGLAADLWHALADGAPDELDVEPLFWTGTMVVGAGEGGLGLPN